MATEPRARTILRLGPVPLHALLAPVPIGALLATTLFDLASRSTATPCSQFPRPGLYLLQVGLLSGLGVALLGMGAVLRLDRSSAAYRAAVRHVALFDAALTLYAISWFTRLGGDFCAAVAGWTLATSLAAAVLLAVGSWSGAVVTYRHGVGVLGDGPAPVRSDVDGEHPTAP